MKNQMERSFPLPIEKFPLFSFLLECSKHHCTILLFFALLPLLSTMKYAAVPGMKWNGSFHWEVFKCYTRVLYHCVCWKNCTVPLPLTGFSTLLKSAPCNWCKAREFREQNSRFVWLTKQHVCSYWLDQIVPVFWTNQSSANAKRERHWQAIESYPHKKWNNSATWSSTINVLCPL